MEEPLYLIAQHLIFHLSRKMESSNPMEWCLNVKRSNGRTSKNSCYLWWQILYMVWMTIEKNFYPRNEEPVDSVANQYPNCKFSNKAHKIPELIGNKYHFSDFECEQLQSQMRNFWKMICKLI